LFLSKPWLRVQ